MGSVLIKETTKEERRKIINGALGISMLDCKAPLDEDMKLYEKYIDGEMELSEVKKKLIEKYKEI
ncbi:hypothetical protein [Clostridium neonatale]|uniref:hypothetical protein n=1 Tax=Clostridium neonatale TaxID=137838 RepID=UPI00291BC2F2|nr:hypothetical protein [Clostridium neonatale]CAI3207895.1 conserved hypothetical protein [Clostridium neonatale]